MKILELIKEKKISDVLTLAKSKKISPFFSHEDLRNQYNVELHDVFDVAKRMDKDVLKPEIDNAGNPVLNEDKTPRFTKKKEFVNRVGMGFQELIVNRRAGFLLGNPVEIYLSDWEGDSIVKNAVNVIWNDNKLDYKNFEIAQALMSQCEVAELWYIKEDQDFWKNKSLSVGKTFNSPVRIKMQILSAETNNELFPVFDAYKDMIAFLRKFKGDVDGKEVEMLDIYTDEFIYHYYSDSGTWKEMEEKGIVPNLLKKIPIVYYYQKYPEWHMVSSLISRRETVLSNIGDENDYFGRPILFVKGSITGFATKSDSGKVLSGTGDAEAKFISWEHAPESLKLELDQLEQGIYKLSQTPDISFENIKGVGNITGVALKFLYNDAHMAARRKEIIIGLGFQRRLNLLKAYIGNIVDSSSQKESNEIELSPVFKPFTPENIKEEIETLVIAKDGGIISTESAVGQNPLVQDTDNEMDLLSSEGLQGESFNL